jgi:hypothetical protein
MRRRAAEDALAFGWIGRAAIGADQEVRLVVLEQTVGQAVVKQLLVRPARFQIVLEVTACLDEGDL